MIVDQRNQSVELRGNPSYVEACARLLEVLDTPPSADGKLTRVVPVLNSNPDSVRRAVQYLQLGADANARNAATPAVAPVGVAPAPAEPPPAAAAQSPPPTAAGPENDAVARLRPVPLLNDLFQKRGQPAAAHRVAQNQAPAAAPQRQPAPGAQPPGGVPAPAGAGVNPETGLRAVQAAQASGLIGSVQIEYIPELEQLIIRGSARDVDIVIGIIEDIERQSVQTQPIVEIYRLKHAGSDALAPLVTQIYSQIYLARQGTVSLTALVKPNALLLIGKEESVKLVIDLIQKLDQPVSPTAQFSTFPLKYAAASAVQATITEYFTARRGTGTGAAASPGLASLPIITVDFRTNTLVVQANPRDLAEVAALVQKLDVQDTPSENELRIFPLQNSIADELAPVLQDAISSQGGAAQPRPAGLQGLLPGGGAAAGGTSTQSQVRSAMVKFFSFDAQGRQMTSSGILSDVRITSDPRANALLVSAPPQSMELIAAIIKELDQIQAAKSVIKVFEVKNGDAASMVDMLENLFGQSQTGGGGAGARAGGGRAGAQGAGTATNVQGENPLVTMRFSVDQRTNAIIASGGADDLLIVEAILLRLDASDVRQRKNAVYRLKNSPAATVATAINQFLTNQRTVQQANPGVVTPFQQIEQEVVVVPEPVTNSLIISATPRYFEEVKKLVEDLDARPPMCMIQVLIAEVTLNNTEEFGVELGLQDSILFDRSLVSNLLLGPAVNTQQAVQGGGTITTTTTPIIASTLQPGFDFNNQPFGNNGSDQALSSKSKVAGQALTSLNLGRSNAGLGYGGLVLSASSDAVSILIRALKECRRLDVLSRPQVMTLDNQPAFVQVGQIVGRVSTAPQNVAATAGVAAAQNFTLVDRNIGLIMGVTPRISPDGLVVMQVDTERSALGLESEGTPISVSANGTVVRQPPINITTAQTTVSAMSGQTIVIGGLLTKNKSATRRRIPMLSSIPILGHLFRYDNETVVKTELLIILTPHVVRNEADADKIKQAEAARMNWCLSDIRKMHGDSGLRFRNDDWADTEVPIVYPDMNPLGAELVPTPAGSPSGKPGSMEGPSTLKVGPPMAPGAIPNPMEGPALNADPRLPGSPQDSQEPGSADRRSSIIKRMLNPMAPPSKPAAPAAGTTGSVEPAKFQYPGGSPPPRQANTAGYVAR